MTRLYTDSAEKCAAERSACATGVTRVIDRAPGSASVVHGELEASFADGYVIHAMF